MYFNTETGENIEVAAYWLQQGECVGIPTETVYGLAANALDPRAVAKIFAVKNRPTFDPLIVHIADVADLSRYTTEQSGALMRLADHFWPGPLTILLPRNTLIPDLVTSGLERVALRVPAHPHTRALLAQLDFPLAAPSANPFGYISPTTAGHVSDQLAGLIPYIYDGGPCGVGVESTIIGLEAGQVQVYRLGGLPIEAIESVLGPVAIQLNQSSNPAAPGMLQSHYAPRKPLFLVSEADLPLLKDRAESGLITFGPLAQKWPNTHHIVLSEHADLSEAAQHLFGALRSLDQSSVGRIYAVLLPETGLGRAVNDRLRRAAV